MLLASNMLRIECDSFHPCVGYASPDGIDEVDCFYGESPPSTSGSTSPGDDIWQKFDIPEALDDLEANESLYPTPPRSPDSKHHLKNSLLENRNCHINAGKSDELCRVIDSFDDEPAWMTQSIDLTPENILKVQRTIDTRPQQQVKSNLIKDCMWSAWKKFLQQDQNKIDEKRQTSEKDTPTNLMSNVTSEYTQSSDCVDPTAIFPYPLSMEETCLNIAGANTPTDSDEEIDVVTIATIDDDSEDDEEENEKEVTDNEVVENEVQEDIEPEEEQVVVEICPPKKVLAPTIHRKHTTWQLAASTPEHDYAKPRPTHPYKTNRGLKRARGGDSSRHTSAKRKKNGVNMEEVKRALQRINKSRNNTALYSQPLGSKGSSRSSSRSESLTCSHSASDSEDSDKRVNHNVLERKRREDLRSAFFRLRDQVPELKSKERASKVVILEKSKMFVLAVTRQEQVLALRKRELHERKNELINRLQKLRKL